MPRRTTGARREAMGGLAKGLEVIRAFTREQPTLTLSEVAASRGLAGRDRAPLPAHARGTRLRHAQRPQFLLRPKVLELGAAYLESMDIEALTQHYLEDLARETGDSAALCVLDGTEIVYVARASVRTLMRLEAHVGSRFPALSRPRWAACCSRACSRERLAWYFDARAARGAHRQDRDRPQQARADSSTMPSRRLLRGRGRARVWRGRGRGAGRSTMPDAWSRR